MGGRAKDTCARRGAGIAAKGAATETLALVSQGRGTEGIISSGSNGARKAIQRSVIGRRETSTMELWKALPVESREDSRSRVYHHGTDRTWRSKKLH